MRYLTLAEVLELHRRIIEQTGCGGGIRELRNVESTIAQPQMTFDGKELYQTLEEKAVALCFSIVINHPFIDGNKRVGHAAMETFLMMNGFELVATIDDSEATILQLASGNLTRGELLMWVKDHICSWPRES